MTEPLTPPDCDLRDFQFMPIDIVRLFGSRFHAVATDAEWRAGVTLWLKSFHQVPAGSLPDDDVEICRLAELGRDIKAWRKLKEGAMHGWVRCSDGRLYHPTVCEKANEAWQRKLVQRERSRKGNEKRWGTTGVSGPPDPGVRPPTEDGPTHPDGHDGIEQEDTKIAPQGMPEASLKDSPSDPPRIARDRDRDRDKEKTLETLPLPRASDAGPVATKPAQWPPDPHPSAITARVGQVVARLEGRARGQQFMTPRGPVRSVAEQAAAVTPTRMAKVLAPEHLATARAQLRQGRG